MFGSRSGRNPDQKSLEAMKVTKTSEAYGTTETENYDRALESLGRILRCLGRHSFDLEELSEEEI